MVRLGEVSCDYAREKCDDMETLITLCFARVIRASSVITLTEGVHVDAHDYRAPALRRIATRAVARTARPAARARIARGGAFGVLPLTHRLEAWIDPRRRQLMERDLP